MAWELEEQNEERFLMQRFPDLDPEIIDRIIDCHDGDTDYLAEIGKPWYALMENEDGESWVIGAQTLEAVSSRVLQEVIMGEYSGGGNIVGLYFEGRPVKWKVSFMVDAPEAQDAPAPEGLEAVEEVVPVMAAAVEEVEDVVATLPEEGGMLADVL